MYKLSDLPKNSEAYISPGAFAYYGGFLYVNSNAEISKVQDIKRYFRIKIHRDSEDRLVTISDTVPQGVIPPTLENRKLIDQNFCPAFVDELRVGIFGCS